MPSALADKIVAIVNEDIITQSELEDFVRFTELNAEVAVTAQEALERLIEDKLILQQAKKEGIRVVQRALEERIKEIKKRYPSEEAFRMSLIQHNLTQSDIENRIREQMLIAGFIETKFKSRIHISPGEITQFYKDHKDEISQPERRRVSALIMEDNATLQKVLDELKEGRDFQEIGKDPDVKFVDLGLVKKGELKKEFDSVVFERDSEGIASYIEGNGGYYVFNISEIIPERHLSLEEAQLRIKEIIRRKKLNQMIDDWLTEVKKNSYIVIK